MPFGTLKYRAREGDLVVEPCDPMEGDKPVLLRRTSNRFLGEKFRIGRRVEYRIVHRTGSGRGPKSHYDFGKLVE